MDMKTPKTGMLQELAAKALDQVDGDAQKALDVLCPWIQTSPELYHELMNPLLRSAASQLISAVCRKRRHHVWVPKNYTKAGNGARLQHLAVGNLMMFPLWNGLHLAEATKADIQLSIKHWQDQGSDMLEKARWLSLVDKHMPGGNKKVKNALTEAKLQELADKNRADMARLMPQVMKV